MKFKVGDKVKNKNGNSGKIQEVLRNACFVNYGTFADFEYFADLKKIKLPTQKQVWKEAEKEKQEQKIIINMTDTFCKYLEKI